MVFAREIQFTWRCEA